MVTGTAGSGLKMNYCQRFQKLTMLFKGRTATSPIEVTGETLMRLSPQLKEWMIVRHYSDDEYQSHGTTSSLTKNYKEKEKKKKTEPVAKIMLISESDNVSVVTLDEAEKIARKKGFQLVQINKEATHTTDAHKSVYKLTRRHGDSHLKKKGVEERHQLKAEKTLMLHSKIAEHDVLSKVKNVLKWIEKGHEVNILIQQKGGSGDLESISKMIEDNTKDHGRVVRQKSKGTDIRLQVLPLVKQQQLQGINKATDTSSKGEKETDVQGQAKDKESL